MSEENGGTIQEAQDAVEGEDAAVEMQQSEAQDLTPEATDSSENEEAQAEEEVKDEVSGEVESAEDEASTTETEVVAEEEVEAAMEADDAVEQPEEEAVAEVEEEEQEESSTETEADSEEEAAEESESVESPAGDTKQGLEEESEDKADADVQASPAEEPDDGREWYVVHCYSGYENKVRHNLEQRIESMGMKEGIFDVVVPTEEEIEVKDGKRKTVERRVFPGYILVNMILSEESWYVVRNTPGVTSFVGVGNEPQALRPEEVASIIKRMEADAPRIKVTFKQGERVRIVDGPFNDFRGTVNEIDMDRAKVRVMVNFFGRETPVELDFLQVEKA